MVSLFEVGQYAEAKKYLRQFLPTIRDACGPDHRATLAVREDLALAILGRGSSREERVEGIAILEEVTEKLRRVLGDAHPDTRDVPSRVWPRSSTMTRSFSRPTLSTTTRRIEWPRN